MNGGYAHLKNQPTSSPGAKDKRPFLLLRYEGDPLTPDEQYLFQYADSIGVNSNLVAYALYPDKLAEPYPNKDLLFL